MADKAVWYYKKENQKEGPISHEELQGKLDKGEIDSTTPVWTDTLEKWVAISEVEHFNLSALDETPAIEVGKRKVVYTRETDEDYVRPRPWVRFWARMIDYSLLYLVLTLLSGALGFLFAPLYPFFGMLILFIWIFIETLFLISWGTTPGKWLLRVTVRDEHHQKLSFSDALNRSFSVWWLGMAAGLPIVVLITMIVAAVKLSNTGMTSWDRRSQYRIFHGKVGIVRCLITILYFVCYFWLFSWGQFELMQAYG